MARETRAGTTVLPDGDPRHGDNGYTNYRCRCPICKRAVAVRHTEYMRTHPEQRDKHRRREAARRLAAGMKPLPPRSERWPLCRIEGCPTRVAVHQLCGHHASVGCSLCGDPAVVVGGEPWVCADPLCQERDEGA